MNIKTDIVIGLSYGDEAKAKCTHHLLKKKTLFGRNKYDYCMRFNGSCNAGHTIYHNGKKIITHSIPIGVVNGIKSIIGRGCVLNPNKFFEEIEYLENNGINCRDLIKIDYATHIITPEHIAEDSKDVKIGTTKMGNGQAYRDKYARIGVRAESIKELQPFLIDIYQELYSENNKEILCEGAQAFGLDIDWSFDYPYCTSSHCTVGGAILNGIPYNSIRNVYGIAKAFDTYVGERDFQPNGKIYEQLQIVGKELGATTGRKRKCNFVNVNLIKKAIDINCVNILIVNKMDVLQEVGVWNVIYNNEIVELGSEKNFKKFLNEYFKGVKIKYSYSPNEI